MREGVELVKLIVFKKLKPGYESKYPDKDTSFAGMLTGAVINDLFGTPNSQERFAAFYAENKNLIQAELKNIPSECEDLRIPLTDALRMQFLCDSQEGIDSEFILKQARQLDILIVERDVPLPKTFLNLVRQLGAAFGILQPPADMDMKE
jgi:hypothetical protein